MSIASTCSLPFSHHRFPNAESLLIRRLAAFDLLLVPAYAAAGLIRRGALQKIPGSPGRAHDPDGAFTIPYTCAIVALVYRGAPPLSLDDLWTRDALWPDAPRLVIGTALLRRGYRLNDANPSHLAQVEEDLLRLRPRIVTDPLAGLRSGHAVLALAPIPARMDLTPAFGSPSPACEVPDRRGGRGVRYFIPPEGAALVEYDWVIPLGARQPQAALSVITGTPIGMQGAQYAYASPPPAIPLTPFLPAARAQLAEIWTRLTGAAT